MIKTIIITGVLTVCPPSDACEWIYTPAYQTKLSMLQNETTYKRAKRSVQMAAISRYKRELELQSENIKYRFVNKGTFTMLQRKLLDDMVDDAYLYTPSRRYYEPYEYREVSADFADDWVRRCKDKLWGFEE